MALWDLKCKALDVPVYELLGGASRTGVIGLQHHGEDGKGSRFRNLRIRRVE